MGSNGESDQTDAIRHELERLEESATWSGQMQFEASKFWRSMNLLLGLPASILAAISGITALASTTGRVIAGIIAIAAAAFGAILTIIDASHRTNQSAAAANAYLEIQTACRQMRELDLPHMHVVEARAMLGELTSRRDEQNKIAEPPNRWIYRKARKNIESGGQAYTVDDSSDRSTGQ